MTGTDGAITLRTRPAEGPVPEVLAPLEAQFVVDWQVADLGSLPAPAPQELKPA